MVRFRFMSDLHVDLKFNGWVPDDVDCDVVVVAGDARAPGTLALPWLRQAFPGREIVYTMGNHDFYSEFDRKNPDAGTKTTYEYQREHAPLVAAEHGIHLLDDSAVILGDVRFVGGTLWTDFSCRPGYVSINEAMREASRRMNDYKSIKTGRGRSGDQLRPQQTLAAHRATVAYLERALCEEGGWSETVVVTHHAPLPNSLLNWDPAHPRSYRDGDACYASETLNHLFTGEGLDGFVPASLWLHGHIHEPRAYEFSSTVIRANPRGYPSGIWRENGPRENPAFDPDLVLEIGDDLVPTFRM